METPKLVCTLKTEYRNEKTTEAKKLDFEKNLQFRISLVGKCRIKGQATKGAGRMPWHWEPKKDVISCDKLRGDANNL